MKSPMRVYRSRPGTTMVYTLKDGETAKLFETVNGIPVVMVMHAEHPPKIVTAEGSVHEIDWTQFPAAHRVLAARETKT